MLDVRVLERNDKRSNIGQVRTLTAWLDLLLADHVARTQPKPCPCHALAYVFQGTRPANGATRTGGPTLADVAVQAGVSTGTVSSVLNRPEQVPDATRSRVLAAAAELGYVRGGVRLGKPAPHWRRIRFATWLFHPATTGWYPGHRRETRGRSP